MRGKAGSKLPSTAVSPFNASASLPSGKGCGLAGQVAQDVAQQARVEHALCASLKEPNDTRLPARDLLHLSEFTGPLDGAQAGQRRAEEIQQQQRDVLIEVQLTVASPIPLGRNIVQLVQDVVEELQKLEPFDTVRYRLLALR